MKINNQITSFVHKSNLDNASNILYNSSENTNSIPDIFNNSNVIITKSLNDLFFLDIPEKINFIFSDSFDWINDNFFKLDISNNTEYIFLSLNERDTKDIFSIKLPENWSLIDSSYSFKDNVDYLPEGSFLYKNIHYRDSLILKTGAWSTKDLNEHWHDGPLCLELSKLFKDKNIKTIVDFGCGTGSYVKFFKNTGFVIDGYDGNPNTVELSNGECSVLDLTTDFELGKTFNCVLSLEVGEHVPKEYEQLYINNLVKYSNEYVIISWGVPGQGGYGHVNCQTNEYIKDEFKKRGYESMDLIEDAIRRSAEASWFANTLMVFKK